MPPVEGEDGANVFAIGQVNDGRIGEVDFLVIVLVDDRFNCRNVVACQLKKFKTSILNVFEQLGAMMWLLPL